MSRIFIIFNIAKLYLYVLFQMLKDFPPNFPNTTTLQVKSPTSVLHPLIIPNNTLDRKYRLAYLMKKFEQLGS
jgi:hypothetical protein